jgi:hypothetical protein
MFFGSILNELHPKIVNKFPDRWSSNRLLYKKLPFDAILIFGCHLWKYGFTHKKHIVNFHVLGLFIPKKKLRAKN